MRASSNEDLDVRCGDCLQILKTIPDGSVNLVVTSPPYADRRKNTYGGIAPNDYVDWFLPIASELRRVLKEDGSFVLNIKENVVDGQRHMYVMALVQALVNQGWRWTEEYIWLKTNPFPGKWPNRFRDAWEHLYHFTRSTEFQMHQERVMVPKGDWAKKQGALSEKFRHRTESATGSGFGRNHAAWLERDLVYPDNVLRIPVESRNRGHSAAYPIALPAWFIQLFSNPGDLVMDPFSGSGTTGVACKMHGRRYLGIDIHQQNCDITIARWNDTVPLTRERSAA